MRRAEIPLFIICALFTACAPAGWPPGATGSVGSPDDGRLIDGVQLQPSDDIVVLEPEMAWGAKQLVDLLQMAAQEMRRAYPDTVPLVVGHLSAREGGPLPPHRSHQSGRDADVAMYARDNKLISGFARMDGDRLDVDKTWYFIETLLNTGLAQYILLDWDVQKIIYDEVQIAVPQQTLDFAFQYPRPRGARQGIIRHAASHANHLHLRIKCPETDAGCVD
jgi:penicillin-insensitive murein endopeptidase